MWVYILFAIFFIFALHKERQALGCPDWPDGTDCDNANGKAVRGSKMHKDMPTGQILDTIEHSAHFQDRWVKWRATFMVATVASIVLVFLLHNRFADEKELVLYTIVMMLMLTLTNGFYRFHLTDHVTSNIAEGVDILRSRSKN